MQHKTKPLVRFAAAALWFFIAAPLLAGAATQTMGFTEADQKSQFIGGKNLPPVAAGGGATEFSLDLRFGTDSWSVLGIAPLIHYNSEKIEVIGISNIAHAGFIKPNPLQINSYELGAPPAVTVAGELVTSDADMVMPLTWMDMDRISAVAEAAIDAPARIITITFQWKTGAAGDSYIGITQSEFGVAQEFRGAGIIVRGPAAARVTAQPASIDVTAGPARFPITCALSRAFSVETTCTLALQSDDADAEALASIILPVIDGAAIVIAPGETSNSRTFHILPAASDSGRILRIALAAAEAGGASLARRPELAEISLALPVLVVSESSIVTGEGETEEFFAKLAARPANGDVVVNIRSSSAAGAAVTPPSLTFTADNWNERQSVFVTGVEDEFADGGKSYTIILAVDAGKTRASHYHGITASVRGIIADNDEARPVLTAEPNKRLATGKQRIVITAALEGGGVFPVDKTIALRKTGGSAVADADYDPFTLPLITIPAGTASAGAAFAITIKIAAAKTIVIAAEFAGSGISIPDITLATGAFDWDVDSSGSITAHDGVMASRYLFGVRGAPLVAGQSHAGYAEVTAHLDRGRGVLDVSGDDKLDGDDGILIARYFLGLRGEALVRNISAPADPEKVRRNIERFLP